MAKKAVDINQLQKLTERGRQRADRREQKKRLYNEQKSEAQAKKLSDDIIAGLPESIKKEARKGNSSLDVYLPGGYPIHDKVTGNLTGWCWKNGFTTNIKNVTFSDDSGPEEVLVISWPKKKN